MKSSAPISAVNAITRGTSRERRIRAAISSGRCRSRWMALRPISRCSPASTMTTSAGTARDSSSVRSKPDTITS